MTDKLLIFSTLDSIRGRDKFLDLLHGGQSVQELIDAGIITFEWPMEMKMVKSYRCPTCHGLKFIDQGTLTYGEIVHHKACSTCNATGTYVSRARAGLADVKD